jgi:light-regulated signal transduction histidine kinase (bacteriophytochrome)
MSREMGKWYSLLWQPIDFDDSGAYEQLKECPKFFYSPNNVSYVKSQLESQYESIYLVECFQTVIFIEGMPTHYRAGKIMPGDLEKYDKWLVDYHGTTAQMLEDIKKKQELYESKLFIEYSNRVIRHDMHSGINTYIPRGLSMLKKKLPEEIIKEYRLAPALMFLEKGINHAQMVYKGIYSFTGLVKQEKHLDVVEFNLGDSLAQYLEYVAYNSFVEVKDLPNISGSPSLMCSALLQLIQNGVQYNHNLEKKVVVYTDEEESIYVEDNGTGMTQEEFNQNIFPKDSMIVRGMGLSIATVIFEEHNYSIEVIPKEMGTIMKIKKKKFLNNTE